MLERYRAKVEEPPRSISADFLEALHPLAAMLATASVTVVDQIITRRGGARSVQDCGVQPRDGGRDATTRWSRPRH